MALTYSPQGGLGSRLPKFELPRVDSGKLSSQELEKAKVIVVMFICGHCPYVQAVEDRLIHLGRQFSEPDVRFVGICANDAKEYPEDSPAALLKRVKDKNYSFPYLVDETQEVAKLFGAVCTPDFFVYDVNKYLAYRGRLDDSWRNPAVVKKQDLCLAIDHLLRGQTLDTQQVPSMGCSIKWKA